MLTFEYLLELEAAIDAASADWKIANEGGDSEGMERAGRASSVASARLDAAVEATTPAVRERWRERERRIEAAHGGPFCI
jgi:hypothetical protein